MTTLHEEILSVFRPIHVSLVFQRKLNLDSSRESSDKQLMIVFLNQVLNIQVYY